MKGTAVRGEARLRRAARRGSLAAPPPPPSGTRPRRLQRRFGSARYWWTCASVHRCCATCWKRRGGRAVPSTDPNPSPISTLTLARWARCLVFVSSQKSAEHVADKLQRAGYAAEALHGGLSQQVRGRRLAALRAAELRVLVATNVAARGLDVASLEAVVNYELPRSTADYTHRVGRTGRAGEAGVAVSFVTSTGPGNTAHFDLIERRHGGMRVPREVVPGPAAIVTRGCNRMCAQAAATCTF